MLNFNNDHLYGPTILARLLVVIAKFPGQNAWAIRKAAGLRKGGARNDGGEMVRRMLIRAEKLGLVTSLKSSGQRLWFVAVPVESEATSEPESLEQVWARVWAA